MITLSKTGKTFTYTHNQETYKADNFFQVLAHIIGNDPDFKGAEDTTWKVAFSTSPIWISYSAHYFTSITGYQKACPRRIEIITEVTK